MQQSKKKKTSPSTGRESVAKKIRRNKGKEEDEGTSSDQLVYCAYLNCDENIPSHVNSSQESVDEFLKQEQLLLVSLQIISM